jgi:hypothetical protein
LQGPSLRGHALEWYVFHQDPWVIRASTPAETEPIPIAASAKYLLALA